MMISDIEMPEMDGYTLTSEIRSDPRMQNLHIILHTSLSGVFNQAMVKKVGANDFLAKFRPDDLASRVVDRIKEADSQLRAQSLAVNTIYRGRIICLRLIWILNSSGYFWKKPVAFC
jgi:two-component system, chemotaxis family, chemotaxis protein CheV